MILGLLFQILSVLKGVEAVCNINNCDPDYCSGDGCIQCLDGYYLSGMYCSKCRSNCVTCTSLSVCTACDTGKHGSTCDNDCRPECPTCTEYSQCTDCIPGRWGPSCSYYCHKGCRDIACEKNSGNCTLGCRHGYYLLDNDCKVCPEHCERCSHVNNCSHCRMGYYGSYCQTACDQSCADGKCDKDTGFCTDGCAEGFYLGTNGCSDCPYRCMRCDDESMCSKCKTGYWGAQCEHDCPLQCNRCNQDGTCATGTDCEVSNCDSDYCSSESCIKCRKGYYLSGFYCYSCPSHCTKCTDSSTCTECDVGRYGRKCEYECRRECSDCVSISQCSVCIPGRYGSYCQFYSPLGCIDILSDHITGKCTLGCRHGFYISGDDCMECPVHCERCFDANDCSICENGYYGDYCENNCPLSCKDAICDKVSGSCIDGCNEGYVLDGTKCSKCPDRCVACNDLSSCSECKTGYWGQQCENECSASCNKCSKEGLCISDTNCDVNNCDTDYCSSESCIKCRDGYYLSGFYCYSCPLHCNKCTNSYTCTECEFGRYGTKCDSECRRECSDCVSSSQCTVCIPGRYGSYCQYYSPLGCIDLLSDQITGKCTLGCRHGFYVSGDDCKECPAHCVRCYNANDCSICEDRYYGDKCENSCSLSCQNNKCDDVSGMCIDGCNDGYALNGTYCSKCPDRCVASNDLSSCSECRTGYWGPQCENECPATCNKCSQQGHCISDTNCDVNNCDTDYCSGESCIKCRDGYYLSGFYCYSCPGYCTKCTDSYTCTECKFGRYGTKCDSECRRECPDCVSSSQCTVCIPGRYGSYCQYYSPLGCIDIVSDQVTGKCTLGCRHGFYVSGDDCNKCPAHCERCSNASFCNICEDGFYGDYCENNCPPSCKNSKCDKASGTCSQGCIAGFVLNGTYCSKCPDRCVDCNSLLSCSECITGYWGLKCELDCPATCNKCSKDGHCISDTDCTVSNCDQDYCSGRSCIKCRNGYYLSGLYCYSCPSHCTKCTDSSTCTECEFGRYGRKCEYECRRECPDCVSSSQCTVCIPGRYGSYCQYYSPLGCIDILSEQTSGKCTLGCRHGFYVNGDDCIECPMHCVRCSDANICSICEDGYYGGYCENSCPSRCKNRKCDKDAGTCIEGCIQGYVLHGTFCSKCPDRCVACNDFSTCSECKTGYWGPVCENECSTICNKCSKDGICINDYNCDVSNCDREFCEGTSCIKCKDGFYLNNRYCYQCPSHCKQCSSSSICTECERGRHGSKCEYSCSDRCVDCSSFSLCSGCIPGRHGSNCDQLCPLGCRDILCDQNTGTCIRGCRLGYFQRSGQCEKCSEHCLRCTARSICTTCLPGFYGSHCENSCDLSCKDQLCNKITGECVDGCSDGYFANGSECNSCPITCVSCSSASDCRVCQSGFWGNQCQFDCPFGCNVCTIDGSCTVDVFPPCDVTHCDRNFCQGKGCIKCEDGYYLSGTSCYQCHSACLKCTESNSCTECMKGRYGNTCGYECNQLCTACTNSTYCTECIPGRHGSNCQMLCSQGCKGIKCDQHTGECIEGCRKGYFAIEQTCHECPLHCVRCANSTSCETCSPGNYGSLCQKICLMGCLHQMCDKDSGYCTDGCVSGYHLDMGYCVEDVDHEDCQVPFCRQENCFGHTCTRCEDRYYVDENRCHPCSNVCIKCSRIDQCEECISGRHGFSCQFHCLSGCKGDVCSKNFGFCTEGCKEGYFMTDGKCQSCSRGCASCSSMDECAKCEVGYWGSSCQFTCSGCNEVGCGQDNNCSYGCVEGYYARIIGQEHFECVACPHGCLTCTSDDECINCRNKYWGKRCHHKCSSNCYGEICHHTSGNCIQGCRPGYYGQTCIEQCSVECETCESPNACIECAVGRYGSTCELNCDINCFKSACLRDNGTCANGCKAGYTGDTCSVELAVTSQPELQSGDGIVPTIALGVFLALAALVIAVLLIHLFRLRKTMKEGQSAQEFPTMMNQTYESQVEIAALEDNERQRSKVQGHSKEITESERQSSNKGDKTEYSNKTSNKDNEDDAYSVIRTEDSCSL